MSDFIRLSPSMRHSWRQCPRKVFFRHIAAIEPIRKSKALAVGKAFHAGLEWFRAGKPDAPDRAAIQYQEIANQYGVPQDSFTALQVMAYVAGYIQRFPDSIRLVEVQVFDDDDGETGFVDSVIERDDGFWVLEDKTTQRFDDAEAMRWSLLFNDQTATYVSALRKRGVEVRGAIFRQVKKTQTKQTQKETPEDYAERILDIYTGESDEPPFREFVIEWTVPQLAAAEKQRERDNLQAIEYLDNGNIDQWPYNPSSCIGTYGPCEFIRLCATRRDASERLFKPNGKEPHVSCNFRNEIWNKRETPDLATEGFDESTGNIRPGGGAKKGSPKERTAEV